jgi:acyl-CoA reductase-like NAD-dependent aldehyde dehydrogenase
MWAIVSVFQQAGLPDGALNLISSEPALAPEVTKALIASPCIKKINFTGSTMVGKIIGKLAGEYLKPVVQELGGKAPAIVWEDADLDLAATQCALGAFVNSGQVCMSTERIIVHEAIATGTERDRTRLTQTAHFPNPAVVTSTQVFRWPCTPSRARRRRHRALSE